MTAGRYDDVHLWPYKPVVGMHNVYKKAKIMSWTSGYLGRTDLVTVPRGGAACAFFKFDSGPKKYVKKVINLIEDSHIK